jgi:hypothetical protein
MTAHFMSAFPPAVMSSTTLGRSRLSSDLLFLVARALTRFVLPADFRAYIGVCPEFLYVGLAHIYEHIRPKAHESTLQLLVHVWYVAKWTSSFEGHLLNITVAIRTLGLSFTRFSSISTVTGTGTIRRMLPSSTFCLI